MLDQSRKPSVPNKNPLDPQIAQVHQRPGLGPPSLIITQTMYLGLKHQVLTLCDSTRNTGGADGLDQASDQVLVWDSLMLRYVKPWKPGSTLLPRICLRPVASVIRKYANTVSAVVTEGFSKTTAMAGLAALYDQAMRFMLPHANVLRTRVLHTSR